MTTLAPDPGVIFSILLIDDCFTADIRAVPVNDGSELMLYGGRKPYKEEGTRAIWKYNLKDDEWSNEEDEIGPKALHNLKFI